MSLFLIALVTKDKQLQETASVVGAVLLNEYKTFYLTIALRS